MRHFSPVIGRRGLLRAGAMSLASSLPGCNGISFNKEVLTCAPPPPNELIVDIHCHVLNLRDADDAAFVVRHIADTDEKVKPASVIVGLLTEIIALPNRMVTMSAREEFEWLREVTGKVQTSSQIFCDAATDRQDGLLFAGKNRHVTGFASNRARNAALLMARYPRVDIFAPLMVDFSEGEATYSSPRELVDFYSQLNIATLGRFLPMVSFNPARAWAERNRTSADSYLRLIKQSIEEGGFVGVKLHPSTGFAPIDNATNGCPNTPLQGQIRLPADQAEFYDRVLYELFLYCRGADVPIMTHSGEGIPANSQCMRNPDLPHDERPNAPALWARAIRKVNAATGRDFAGTPIDPSRRLRVCFAHMAGGFQVVNGLIRPHPWLTSACDLMHEHEGLYIDLSDQAEVLEQNGETFTASKVYKTVWENLMSANPLLGWRTMYGSDWHMPSVSAIGQDYLGEIERLVPDALRPRVMGWNAVDYLGLKPGRPTRKRLDCFYRKHGIEGRVAWMDKIKARV